MIKMKTITKRNCVRAAGASMTGLVAGLLLLLASFVDTGALEAKYTGRHDFLPKGPLDEDWQTESRMLIGKAKKVAGGKGSSTGSSSGSGSSMMSAAYVDGEYYGCLALSEEQQADLRKSGRSCDYTIHIHYDESKTGKSKNKNSSSGNNAAASSSTGDGSNGSANAATAEAGNEAGESDGYTISYYYEDKADGTDGSGGSDQADGETASEQTGTSQPSNSGNNGKNKGSNWYSWK